MQNNENEKQEVKPNDNNQYIEALAKVKETTVPKEDFDRLKEENKKLLDHVINGTELEGQGEKPEPIDLDGLRKELFEGENTNLEYCQKALKLRNELIAQGKPDPFLPVGNQISPTDYDIEKAQQVADVLQECVDYADGDSAIFTQELMRRTQDVKIR